MNRSSLKNRRILLGVTGGIAVYKAADLVRRLKSEGADVTVMMTEASRRFVSPLTFESLSGNRVLTDIFTEPLAHIEVPGRADLLVMAPATANIIGKLAAGLADDIVSLSFTAYKGPVLFAPAMNWRMYEHPLVRRNIETLKELGLREVPPDVGELACGERGVGRMAPVSRIIEEVKASLSDKDLAGLKVLVTAGPTREPIDPVRFVSNRSSGKMGYALARVALRRGAEVTLVSGPVSVEPPGGARFIEVETAEEMLRAVMNDAPGMDLLVMAAAVSDFAPEGYSTRKREKGGMFTIGLRPTPDIVKAVAGIEGRPFIIGFSAETGPDVAKARKKLEEKGMDFIVFNDVTLEGAGFDTDTNKVTIIDREGGRDFPLMSKEDCAEVIFDHFLRHRREKAGCSC